jgi:uncharacterized protein involved in exopolysaccharide biosynthesis
MMDLSVAQQRLDDAVARTDAATVWWPDSPMPAVLRRIIRALQYILDNWPNDVTALQNRVTTLEAEVATLQAQVSALTPPKVL